MKSESGRVGRAGKEKEEVEKKKEGERKGSSGCDEKIMRQIRPVSVQCGHIGTTWQEWILVEMLKDNRQR